jgi:hypothetical protein
MRRAAGILALAVASVVVLAGCVGEPQPAPSSALATNDPTPRATPTPSTTGASPTPTGAAASLPRDCEELLPVAQIGAAFGEEWELAPETVEINTAIPGPEARRVAGEALESIDCLWWPVLATEAHFAALGFVLSSDARGQLVSKLEGARGYEAVEIDGADAAFSYAEVKGDLRYTSLYSFVGDVWVVAYGPVVPDVLNRLASDLTAGIVASEM